MRLLRPLLLAALALFALPSLAQTPASAPAPAPATFDGGTTFAPPPLPAPVLGVCNATGTVCVGTAGAVIPFVVDLSTGNVARDVAFSVGYGVTFHRGSAFAYGLDALFGTQTSGGWNAAALAKLNLVRAGPVISHQAGHTSVGIGMGLGTDF